MQSTDSLTESLDSVLKFEFQTLDESLLITAYMQHAIYEVKYHALNQKISPNHLQQSLQNHQYLNTTPTFQTLKFTCCGIQFSLTNKQVLAVSQFKSQRSQLKNLIQHYTDQLAAKTKLLPQVTQKLFQHKTQLKQKQKDYNLKTKLDPRTEITTITEPELIELLSSDLHFPNLEVVDVGWNKGANTKKYELQFFEGEVPASYKRPNYYVGDPALKALAENGHKYPNLKKIDFGDNNIKDEGFKNLAQNGQKFPNLQQIYIYDNQLKDQGLIALAQNSHNFISLKELVLCQNEISDKAFKTFVEQCSKMNNLQQLNFTYNKIECEGAKALAINGDKFSSLKIINLRDNSVTDDFLKTLLENAHNFPILQQLNLRGARINDVGFKVLTENGQKFPNLQEIYFHSNQITDEGFNSLVQNGQKFTKLHTVDLCHNQITDVGLKFLLENRLKFPKTPAFYLSSNKISFKLRQSLSGDQNLQFNRAHPKCGP